MYGEGVSKVGEILDLAVELEIVKKAGSWFSYETNKLGQGRDAVKEMLKDNVELAEELEARIKAKVSASDEALVDDKPGDQDGIVEKDEL
jgi:recombination protein RecA